jgi:hypothetical protein
MGSWEDELDLDLSDIWAAGSKAEQKCGEVAAQEDGGDDLAFPTQAAGAQEGQCEARVSELQSENAATPVLNAATPVLNADFADAPTQVASLSAEPYISRGGPIATQNGSKQRLPPLPSFQAVVVSREGGAAAIATQSLALTESDGPRQRLASGLRNPNSREKDCQQPGADIRRYFAPGASSSGADGGGPRKKPRIPGPVGDLFQKDEEGAVKGDGHGLGAREDDFNDRDFRKGAWICALQSLNVEEFDPGMHP